MTTPWISAAEYTPYDPSDEWLHRMPYAGSANFSAMSSFAATGAGTGYPPPSFRDIEYTTTSAGDSHVVNMPASEEGDLIVATVIGHLAGSPLQTPSGWFLHENLSNQLASNVRYQTFYRVASSSEPSSYTWSVNVNDIGVGVIVLASVAAYQNAGASLAVPSTATINNVIASTLSSSALDMVLNNALLVYNAYVRSVAVPAISSSSSPPDILRSSGFTTISSEHAFNLFESVSYTHGETSVSKTINATANWSAVGLSVYEIPSNVQAGSGPIAFRAASTDEKSVASADVVITKPIGTQPNDHIIAVIELVTASQRTYTAPAGWTLIAQPSESNAYVQFLVFFKRAGNSEPSSYTFTFSSAAKSRAIALSYSGLNPICPFGSFNVFSFASTVGPIDFWHENSWGLYVFGGTSFGSTPPTNPDTSDVERISGSTSAALKAWDSNRPMTKGTSDSWLHGSNASPPMTFAMELVAGYEAPVSTLRADAYIQTATDEWLSILTNGGRDIRIKNGNEWVSVKYPVREDVRVCTAPGTWKSVVYDS